MLPGASLDAVLPVAIPTGAWVAMTSRFLVGPLFGPPVFFLISRLGSFGWHIQQITFGQQYFKR